MQADLPVKRASVKTAGLSPSVIRKPLAVCTVILLATLVCSSSFAQPAFPVYPGAVKALDMSGAGVNSAHVMFTTPDAMQAVLDWHAGKLRDDGWEVEAPPPANDFMGTILADKPDEQLTAIVTVASGAEAGRDTMFQVHVTGPGVNSDIFKDVPALEAPRRTPEERQAQRAEARRAGEEAWEELFRLHPELRDVLPAKPGDPMPTPPNDFQQSMTDLRAALSELLKAMGAWCGNTSERNRAAVLAAGEVYRGLAQAVADQATEWTGDPGASTASTAVFFQNMLTNINLGIALMGIEGWPDVPDEAGRRMLLEQIRHLVRHIRDEDAKALIATMGVADQVVDVAKRDPDNDGMGGPDTPLTRDLIARAGTEFFVPRTDLVVTRLWTPTPDYWEQALRETWTHLRCWNANCPDGCHPIEDTDLFHCEAFGRYDLTTGDPPRTVHCLGVENNYEHQVEYLSYPMTLYGLVSLQIKVGDPEQLDQGGEVRFFINDQPLMTTELEPIHRPFDGNINLWDMERKYAGTDTPIDISLFEKWAQGVDFLFGEEAGQQWRNSFRSPWVTAESRGGEFNGYVLSTVVGQVYGAGGLALDLSPPPLAFGESPLTMMLKMRDIAERNHPALEKPSVVRIEAVVGGVAAEAVEFVIPAVFDDLRGQAEAWGSWPADNPEEWKFGAELGAVPPKEVPPKIDINAIALDLMEDSQKMAHTYQKLIAEEWRKKVTDMALSELLKYSNDAFDTAMKDLPTGITSGGWQYVRDAVSWSWNWVRKHGSAGTMGDKILGDQMGSFLKDIATKHGIDVIQEHVLKDLNDWRDTAPYYVSRDLTLHGLTEDARQRISYLRWLMWVNGETALKIHGEWGKVENITGYGGIATTVGGPVVKAYLEPILTGVQAGGYAGLLTSNLYSLWQIERCLVAIETILSYPHSWVSRR